MPPDNKKHPDYKPIPPTQQAMPVQEAGTRPARSVPYELDVMGELDVLHGGLHYSFQNSGKAAAVFQVRSNNNQNGPWTYTVGPRDAYPIPGTSAITVRPL